MVSETLRSSLPFNKEFSIFSSADCFWGDVRALLMSGGESALLLITYSKKNEEKIFKMDLYVLFLLKFQSTAKKWRGTFSGVNFITHHFQNTCISVCNCNCSSAMERPWLCCLKHVLMSRLQKNGESLLLNLHLYLTKCSYSLYCIPSTVYSISSQVKCSPVRIIFLSLPFLYNSSRQLHV